jgi:hypothetical protein
VGTGFRVMANKRIGIARWHRELQEEEQVALENSVQALHIKLNNLLAKMLTTMESLVEQRQAQHQLQVKVTTIRYEVEVLLR